MAGAPALVPVDPAVDYFDKPWLVANPSNGDLYLAVTWKKAAGGTTVVFFRSLDGAQTWEHREFVDATGLAQAPYLAVSGGSIYLFWRTTGSTDPIRIRKSTDRGLNFQNSGQDGTIPNSQLIYNANLRRNSHDPNTFAGDEFRAPAIFQAAVNPQSAHLYLVYHDREPVTAPDTDILFQYSTNGGANWFAPMRINDVQAGDQWQPCIAVKPDGLKLFIGWYDRKQDATFNHRIRVRGMISTINAQTPLASLIGRAHV